MSARLVLAAGAALPVLAGCSVTVGTPGPIPKAEVERGATQALTEKVGKAPTGITCPGDLDKTVGASERCTLSDNGTSYGMTVTVTAVDEGSGTVHYQVEVDTSPSPGVSSAEPSPS